MSFLLVIGSSEPPYENGILFHQISGDFAASHLKRASLGAQLVKTLPAIRETWVGSLAWEDPLAKGMAAHSSVLAWRIPWTVQAMGSQRVFHIHISLETPDKIVPTSHLRNMSPHEKMETL